MGITEPSITVVVLIYNDLPHALNAIESVLSQTYDNFELLIVDNGCTDGTWRAIQRYRVDARVRFYRQRRNQRSDGVQAVTDTINTKFLSFLFADDIYEPERIANALGYLENNSQLDFLFFGNHHVDEKGEKLEEVHFSWFTGDISSMDKWQHLRHFFVYGNTLHPCGMVVKTELYQRLGGFPNFMHRMGDMVFFTKLLANAEGLFLPEEMQKLTVWSSGKNESIVNVYGESQFFGERTLFLDEYLKPPIFDNLIRIFGGRQSAGISLETESEKAWYLAHQALSHFQIARAESLLFGLRLLYKVADIVDEDFEQQVIRATGHNKSEYIYNLVSRLHLTPPYVAPVGHISSGTVRLPLRLKIALKKRAPFLVPIYRYIKGRPISDP
jgi:glycosyltransferase involved in cell wall biosynthesis